MHIPVPSLANYRISHVNPAISLTMAAATAHSAGLPGTDPLTLTRYILAEQSKHPEAQGDLTILMQSIQLACKTIATAVRKAGIAGLYGLHGAVNVQGEDVKKLDIVANENFINTLRFSNKVSVLVSEEDEEPVVLTHNKDAKYAVVFDPLDGSSNIDCNVSVGSIFGIYKRVDPSKEVTVADVLQPGSELVVAGYCMYGSSTQMVITIKGCDSGVSIFTLDPAVGEFMLTSKKVTVPAKPKTIYSINEGNWATFPQPVKDFITACKGAAKPYSLRYVGSMVADVHRTLLYGGVFMYPATTSNPKGKLRLLYECNPMSLLMETAGGKASTGAGRVLDVMPTSIHERCPIYLGCARDVEALDALFAAEASRAAGATKRARTDA